MLARYQLFYDSLHEAEWLAAHSAALASADLIKIDARGLNEPAIDSLVQYDRPDVIVTINGKPVLTVEKTREVPTGHNVGQRMARLVRSAELGVPVIYKAPFDAMKHGDYAGICNLNIRLLEAFRVMKRFHGVPVVALNTTIDKNHEILDIGNDEEMEAILSGYLPNLNLAAFERAERYMLTEYARRLKVRPAYGRPPPSVKIISTKSFISSHPSISTSLHRRMSERAETVVYQMRMTSANCRREDPYTGTAFVYDYMLCRTGARVTDKSRNLILSIPDVSTKRWIEANPNDPGRKSSNWYLTATALSLSDGLLPATDGSYSAKTT